MKTSTLATAFMVVATQVLSVIAASTSAAQPPKATPVLGTPTSQGCYLSAGNMTDSKMDAKGVSSGSCIKFCKAQNAGAIALGPQTCKCGNAYPPKSDLTDDNKCNSPCPAYGLEACGGIDDNTWSIYNTGLQLSLPYYEEEKASSSSSSVPAATSTDASTSATGDPSASATSKPEEKDSGPSIGPIVGGVVAGVVVVCGVVGGLFFFMRRRRNSEIEEEYRRNAAVNAFISGSKPPGSSAGSISMTDSRLDPIKAHRLSDGSIADNEDYSRKILRVTNA